MPETVCVTAEQLRDLSVQYSGQCDRGGYAVYVCPACRMTAVKDSRICIHAVHCWIGNAIAQAERLKDWTPKVGDRVRLRAMPDAGSYKVLETIGRMCRIGLTASSKVIFGMDGKWRERSELMPEEG